MPFRIDPNAAKMPDDYERLTREQVAPLLKGSQFICESIQDNDMERWALSQGGQFVRQTGLEGTRFYVVPPAEAYDTLNGWVEERVMDDLRAALDKHGIEYQKGAAYAM